MVLLRKTKAISCLGEGHFLTFFREAWCGSSVHTVLKPSLIVPIKGSTKGSDLLESVMATIKILGLSLSKLSGITIDGAPSMLIAEVKKDFDCRSTNFKSLQCVSICFLPFFVKIEKVPENLLVEFVNFQMSDLKEKINKFSLLDFHKI